MKKKLLMSVCLILSIIYFSGMIVAQADTTDKKQTMYETNTNDEIIFNDISDVKNTINKIYNKKFLLPLDKGGIYELSKSIRKNLDGDSDSSNKKTTTLYQNCGPYSEAFQYSLACDENPIYLENRITYEMPVTTYDTGSRHEFNLLRTRFVDSDKVSNIVIDLTYRQCFRDFFSTQLKNKGEGYVTNKMIDQAMLDSKLPDILIYEYGKEEEAKDEIRNILGINNNENNVLEMDLDTLFNIFHERKEYLDTYDQSLQSHLLLSQDTINILRDGPSYLNLEGKNYYLNTLNEKYLFVDKGNGIYETIINMDDYNGNLKFNISDENNNVLYNKINYDEMTIGFPYREEYTGSYSYNKQCFASKSTENSNIFVSAYGKVIIRIDLRSGENRPCIKVALF